MRSLFLALLLALVAGAAGAQDWGKLAAISTTMGVSANQVCLGEGSRGDIGCPTYAPYVTSGGLVGIGTSTPGELLDIVSSSTANVAARVYNTSNGNAAAARMDVATGLPNVYGSYQVYNDGGNPYLQMVTGPAVTGGIYLTANAPNAPIVFQTSATVAMLIQGNGSVGIGTSAPSANLDVSGTVKATGYSPSFQAIGIAGTNFHMNKLDNPTDRKISEFIQYDNILRGRFANDIYSQSSDWLQVYRVSGTYLVRSVEFPSGNVGIGVTSPTAKLEVNGTVSATHFVGDGSGHTGIAGVSGTGGDRIVSGSVSVIAQQTSGTVRVSGTLALANSGNEVCDSTKWYSFRVNPSTGMMQMCRP